MFDRTCRAATIHVVLRAGFRSRSPAAVMPSTVFRRRSSVPVRVAAGVWGGNRLHFSCIRKRGCHLWLRRPISARLFLHVLATSPHVLRIFVRIRRGAGGIKQCSMHMLNKLPPSFLGRRFPPLCRCLFGIFRPEVSPAVPLPIWCFQAGGFPRRAGSYSAFLGWRFPRRANAK
jgi:hypothetical protein